jgi:hypothetical protein
LSNHFFAILYLTYPSCYTRLVLKQPSFWATVAGAVGIPALLAGLSILAVAETDHRYGWALVFAAAVVIASGALLAAALYGTPSPPATRLANAGPGGLANTGPATSQAQSGGQTANVIYNIHQQIQDPPNAPTLQFGEPSPSRETIYDHQGRPMAAVILYRVELTNISEGTKAINVSIQLAKSVPALPVLPVEIHKFHDDERPYTQSHEVRYGQPIILDVFAKATDADEFFLWRSDLPDGYGYVYHLSPPEKNSISDSLRHEGLIITLKAVPDPPARFEEQSYTLLLDAHDNLAMKRISD